MRFVLTESRLRRIISECVKTAISEGKYYSASDQWEDEISIFMDGLKNGNAEDFGDCIAVRFGGASNDPRYIVYEYGSGRLRDDHFYMQHSRPLTREELRDIVDYAERMGVDTNELGDDYYGAFE